MLGSLILYLKGTRTTMFQLSGFCYRIWRLDNLDSWQTAESLTFLKQ